MVAGWYEERLLDLSYYLPGTFNSWTSSGLYHDCITLGASKKKLILTRLRITYSNIILNRQVIKNIYIFKNL